MESLSAAVIESGLPQARESPHSVLAFGRKWWNCRLFGATGRRGALAPPRPVACGEEV